MPSHVTKALNDFRCRAVSLPRYEFHKLHQTPIRLSELGRGHITLFQCLDYLLILALQLQEVAMRANSVGALIQAGHQRGDHLLGASGQMPVGELERIGQVEHPA